MKELSVKDIEFRLLKINVDLAIDSYKNKGIASKFQKLKDTIGVKEAYRIIKPAIETKLDKFSLLDLLENQIYWGKRK